MRSGLLALRAAGLVAAMVAVPVLGTTAADAHDSVNATVSPSDVRPGGEVKIKVTGCANPRSAAARSGVFVADSELAARKGDDKKPTLLGEAKIKSSTKDGKYKADVWCDGHDHLGAAVFEVDRDAKPKASAKASAKPSAKASTKPSAKPKPKQSTKASSKPPTKSSAKASPKASAKASTKPSAKSSAKPSAKASEKASAKPKPKQSTKASSKPPTKPPAKPSARASAKPQPSPKSEKANPKPNKTKPEGQASAVPPRPLPPMTSAPPPEKLMPAPIGTARQSQAPWTPRSAQARPSERQASPVAPVRAGGGGRTSTALAGDEAGPSIPHTVIGLVLAGVAAVAVAIRSARRRRSAARDSD